MLEWGKLAMVMALGATLTQADPLAPLATRHAGADAVARPAPTGLRGL